MRSCGTSGFSLFKLAPALYARSALPRPFVYNIPAQNTSGQIAWADALYVRDDAGGDPDRRRNLALILDIYGLEDAAADILLETPGLFGDDTWARFPRQEGLRLRRDVRATDRGLHGRSDRLRRPPRQSLEPPIKGQHALKSKRPATP